MVSGEAAANRRSIDDLMALHVDLERDLRDVYVEGRRDARRIAWYARESGLVLSGIYAVDDRAEVPGQMVRDAGGEIGPRGRVLGLAAAAADWDLEVGALTFVIDADRDLIWPGTDIPNLLRTDVGSMDCYGFQERPLEQFLGMVLDRDVSSRHVIEVLTPALHDLFLIRSVLHAFGPDIPVVDRFLRCVTFSRTRVEVDVRDLIRRSLAASGQQDQLDRILSHLGEVRNLCSGQSPPPIRGHDIAPMLAGYLGLRNDWAKSDVIEQSMRGVLRPEDVDDAPLFRQLRERLQPPG
jgi:hypothetical protein